MGGRLPAWACIALLASLVMLVFPQNTPARWFMDDDDDADDDDAVFRASNCSRTHPRVALRAAFQDFEGRNIGGAAVIRDDCSVVLRRFTYDGTGADTAVVGAQTRDALGNGTVFFELPMGRVWNGTEVLELFLDDGLTWTDIDIISVWDRQLAVDFGSADLTTGFIPGDVADYTYDDDDDGDPDDDDGDEDDDGVPDAQDPDFDDDDDV